MRFLFSTIIASMATILACQCAHSAQLETSLGVSDFFYAHDCSTWYQCGPDKPHQLNMVSPSLGIGITDVWHPLGLQIRGHVGFQYLGRVTSHAVATTGPDFAPGYPLAHFNGAGDVRGFYAAAEYEKEWRGITWGIGPGVYLYKPTWQETIPDWSACMGCAVTPLTVTHDPKWQNTPTLSITAAKGQNILTLTYLHHVTAEGDQWPALYDINRTSKRGKVGIYGMFNLGYTYRW